MYVNCILLSLENYQTIKSKFSPILAIDKMISTVTLQVISKREFVYSFLIFPIVYEMIHFSVAITAFFSCPNTGGGWLHLNFLWVSCTVRMISPAGFMYHWHILDYFSHRLHCCWNSDCDSVVTSPTRIHEDAGLIPGPVSRLRIWHCHELQWRSQTWLGSCIAMAVV